MQYQLLTSRQPNPSGLWSIHVWSIHVMPVNTCLIGITDTQHPNARHTCDTQTHHMLYTSHTCEIHKRETLGPHQIANQSNISYTSNIDIKYIPDTQIHIKPSHAQDTINNTPNTPNIIVHRRTLCACLNSWPIPENMCPKLVPWPIWTLTGSIVLPLPPWCR